MIKVEPSMDTDEESKAQRGKKSRYANVFAMSVWTVAGFLGLLPFKIDKETKECSFKWFSTETIFAFARLVLFNAPLSVLPCLLFLLNFNAEWGGDDKDENQWGRKTKPETCRVQSLFRRSTISVTSPSSSCQSCKNKKFQTKSGN